jgi:hypothetical protein
MTWRCPVCGKENDDSNDFCRVCLFERSNAEKSFEKIENKATGLSLNSVAKETVPISKLSRSEKASAKEKIMISLEIPGGLLYNKEQKRLLGYVRTKRGVIELEKQTYIVWIQGLRPQKMGDLDPMWQNEKVPLETLINNMERAGLMVVFNGSVDDDYTKISKLTPLPIGMIWTSYEKDLDLVTVASAEGAERVALSPLAFIFWTFCDYQLTISEIYNKIASLYKIDPTLLKSIILETFKLLMDNRLLFAVNDKTA